MCNYSVSIATTHPPYKMRISSERVMEELKDAGFDKFEVNKELLPYQYIIKAMK